MEYITNRNAERLIALNRLIAEMDKYQVDEELQKKTMKIIQILKSCGLDPRLLNFGSCDDHSVSVLIKNKTESKQVISLYVNENTFGLKLL